MVCKPALLIPTESINQIYCVLVKIISKFLANQIDHHTSAKIESKCCENDLNYPAINIVLSRLTIKINIMIIVDLVNLPHKNMYFKVFQSVKCSIREQL